MADEPQLPPHVVASGDQVMAWAEDLLDALVAHARGYQAGFTDLQRFGLATRDMLDIQQERKENDPEGKGYVLAMVASVAILRLVDCEQRDAAGGGQA